eukprot:TRINITY_DN14190_c0_g1_i1.p1 TRINITY_DN14190_c0_g1~~TRINITY_DN14190_c0_g1_i1.p1  ORF type:complete len:314 (+),score=50.83 TRINITY_DN14190_c0_g1_i1:171-1112(+)
MENNGEAVKSAFSRSGVLHLEGDNTVVSTEVLGRTLQMLEPSLSEAQLGQVIDLADQHDGHVDINSWVDRIFSSPPRAEVATQSSERSVETDTITRPAMTSQQKNEPGANDQMIRLPTPARQCQDAVSLSTNRGDQVPVEQCTELEAPSALLNCSCYECLAFFLDVEAMWRLSCTCTALRSELTVAGPADAEGECDANIKLLVPVLELKGHSSESMLDLEEHGYPPEALLDRVATTRVRILRMWQRGAFEAVAEVVRSGGPRQWQSLERIAFKGCPLFQEDFECQQRIQMSSNSRRKECTRTHRKQTSKRSKH